MKYVIFCALTICASTKTTGQLPISQLPPQTLQMYTDIINKVAQTTQSDAFIQIVEQSLQNICATIAQQLKLHLNSTQQQSVYELLMKHVQIANLERQKIKEPHNSQQLQIQIDAYTKDIKKFIQLAQHTFAQHSRDELQGARYLKILANIVDSMKNILQPSAQEELKASPQTTTKTGETV